jgi:cyclopropane-fatty-acyl-phospholipid synthase
MNAVVAPLSKTPARIDLLLRKALLDKLARLENAVLTIADPLGESVLGAKGTDGLRARIDVLDMSFYRQIALGGSIGAAESYMDQEWQADDLCRVIQILVRNRDLLDSMEGGMATLANQLLKVWHFANRNSQQGSRKNIAAHYDLGNQLFALLLDQHGMYSSATFYHPELSL